MESIWTPELVEELTTLWDSGMITAEIGRKLNVSKNAAVGKAHRLNLKPRPSPLKRPPARRFIGITAPSCTWPSGHPGEEGFHFCGKRPMTGKLYCTEHAGMAYVAPKKERAKV